MGLTDSCSLQMNGIDWLTSYLLVTAVVLHATNSSSWAQSLFTWYCIIVAFEFSDSVNRSFYGELKQAVLLVISTASRHFFAKWSRLRLALLPI
jgi:hypothetical protein